MSLSVQKINKVPLREIWKKEDKDFTRWLEDHIDYLSDVLGFNISIISREEKVGPFRVDLFCEDDDGHKVIIENQLEPTDHSHLGQIMTYLTNLEANTAIWITSKPVEEHIKAIAWLNENAPEDIAFYIIKLEAIRIGDNPTAAPLFTIVEGPTDIIKEIGKEKKAYAERHHLRKEFWTELLDKAKEKTKLHANVSPCIYSWVGAGAGHAGIGYNYVIANNASSVEVYLDRGKDFPDINKERFDELFKYKDKIEEVFGDKLSWERLNDRRASRIAFRINNAGLKNRDKWPELQDKMIDSMIRLKKATEPFIKKLN